MKISCKNLFFQAISFIYRFITNNIKHLKIQCQIGDLTQLQTYWFYSNLSQNTVNFEILFFPELQSSMIDSKTRTFLNRFCFQIMNEENVRFTDIFHDILWSFFADANCQQALKGPILLPPRSVSAHLKMQRMLQLLLNEVLEFTQQQDDHIA